MSDYEIMVAAVATPEKPIVATAATAINVLRFMRRLPYLSAALSRAAGLE